MAENPESLPADDTAAATPPPPPLPDPAPANPASEVLYDVAEMKWLLGLRFYFTTIHCISCPSGALDIPINEYAWIRHVSVFG